MTSCRVRQLDREDFLTMLMLLAYLSAFIAMMNSEAFVGLAHAAGARVFDRLAAFRRRHFSGGSPLGAGSGQRPARRRRRISRFRSLRYSWVRRALRGAAPLGALRVSVVVFQQRGGSLLGRL